MRPVFNTAFKHLSAPRLAQRGVTLIEMIVAIVIGGILIAMVGMFIRNQVQSYSDVAARTELADAAQSAVQRITYDLQNALPNSVRTTGNFLEFVPITDGGRYRAQKGVLTDNELDFTSNTSPFNVLGPPVTVNANDQLVIFNLGIPGADVYAGTNRRVISSAAGALSNITYAGAQFPLASPTNRFQVVGGPVTLECAANAAVPESGSVIRRWCYAYADPQPTAFATAYTGCAAVKSAIVVSGVSACSMNYTPAALQRNGMVSVAITLTKNGENVSLLHQAAIINTP
jgi:MSHA biogenesis protein MshO